MDTNDKKTRDSSIGHGGDWAKVQSLKTAIAATPSGEAFILRPRQTGPAAFILDRPGP